MDEKQFEGKTKAEWLALRGKTGLSCSEPAKVEQALLWFQQADMAGDALIRWEEIRREHLGGAIALLFGLSSASLAFCGSLLTQGSVKLGGERTTWFLWAVGSFVAALLVSLLVILTRLQDVRTTANIVRKREDPMAKAEVERLRSRARCWGRLTWWLFRFQLLTFSAGACFLLVALWYIFHSKLFP